MIQQDIFFPKICASNVQFIHEDASWALCLSYTLLKRMLWKLSCIPLWTGPISIPPWDYLARKMHHFHWKNSGLNRKQNTFHGWTKLLINIPIKWADNRGNEYTPLTNLGPCAKAKYLGYKSMYARWCLTINSLWQRTMVNCQQH